VPKPTIHSRSPAWCRISTALAICCFLWLVAQFYVPGKGFTAFITFGEKMEERYLPELRATGHYTLSDSYGYDSQYYAQLAMDPRLGDPALGVALDNLPYRARRILLSWTAWALGGGDPVRALHVFSFQNVVTWLLLAVLLWRWFPPQDWQNVFRWFGVLFSAGMIWSVRGALLDGPGLLFLAGAVALVETGRPWWSALLLGVSGLAKETNVLAGLILAPSTADSRRDWFKAIGKAAVLALPLVLWLSTIWWILRDLGDPGARNFAPPFFGFLGRFKECLASLQSDPFGSIERYNLLVLVALLVQALFFVARPRWSDPWWRIGAMYTGLMIVIGDAVWEGFPMAAVRVLLPMQLAFNLLVPRGRKRWLLLLLLGNLTLFTTPHFFLPPVRDGYRIEGASALRVNPSNNKPLSLSFEGTWFPEETSYLEYWRWTGGTVGFTVHNPHAFPVLAELHFGLRSNSRRHVTVRAAGRPVWERELTTERQEVSHTLTLPPGTTSWRIESPEPALPAGNGGPRLLAFSVRDLKVILREQEDGEKK